METRPPDLVLFDHGDREPRRGAVERGRVSTRAATDDDDVEFLGARF